MTTKPALRKKIKEERKNIDVQDLSLELLKKLQKTDEYRRSKNIMLFYPLISEINLLPLLEDNSKNFYLPRIKEKNLLCCPFVLGDELSESCFKTKEPKTAPIDKSLLDLVIVPALAVDKNNYRLGYGGGYYDRFLNGINAVKIVCISKDFVVETVYPEAHDIRIDKIICA